MPDISISAGIDDQISPAAKKIGTNVTASIGQATREFKKLESAARRAADAPARVGSLGMSAGGNSKGAYKAGQVALQAQDIAVQAQMGVSASRIMLQQGTQLASIFGPTGSIIGGIAAGAILLYEWKNNTEKARKEVELMEAALKKVEAVGIKLVKDASDSMKDADVMKERRTRGNYYGDLLKLEKEHTEKIIQIRHDAGVRGSNFEKAENRKFHEEKLALAQALEQSELQKDKLQHANPAIKLDRVNSTNAAKQLFEQEKTVEKLRLDAEAEILNMRESGSDSELVIARAQTKAASAMAAATHKRSDALAARGAEVNEQKALRASFVEEMAFKKEFSMLNMRGSAYEKHLKQLKIEEEYLRRISDNKKDALSTEEAVDKMRVRNTPSEQRQINLLLAQNQAAQGVAFHDKTFGKTQAQIRAEFKADAKSQKEEEKWRARQTERGGLIDVKRDARGNVIEGFDPTTGKRVSGDAAIKAMQKNRELIKLKPNTAERVLVDDASINKLVTSFALEIEKLIAK